MKKFNCFLRVVLLCVVCSAYVNCIAQKPQAKIDSLLQNINTYKFKCADTCLADSSKVIIINSLAWELGISQPKKAIAILDQSLKISEKIKWLFGIAQSNNHLCSIYQIMGENNIAMKQAYAAIAIWEKILANDSKNQIAVQGYAASYGNLATIYLKTGQYNEALKIFFEIQKIFEQQGSEKRQAITFGNIAYVYMTQNDFVKAIEYSQKALTICEKLKDTEGLMRNYGNLGICYQKIKEYHNSINFLSKALELAKKLKSNLLIAKVLSNISNIYEAMKDYPKALDFSYQALEYDSMSGNKEGKAIRQVNLSSIYYEMKNYQKAEELLKSCYNAGIEANNVGIKKGVYEGLRKIYESTNRYQQAFEYYKREKELNDSLFNDKKKDEFIRLEKNYEFSKREDSIKAFQDKELALAALEKRNALEKAEKKRLLNITESKLILSKTENQRIIAESNLEISEAERKRTLSETEKKIAITEAEKKRTIAEANAKKAAAETEAKKQIYFKNFILAATGIIALSSILIFAFYKRKRDAEQKQKETALNLQVSETEMKALRSQMNPHFIYNAMHSIQFYLRAHKSAEAEEHLLKFADLTRLVLENSQHSEVPLEKDMSALELYMQLECKRLQYPFTYQFDIDETVDKEETYIPPLILQPFVENAIWHGLQHKPGPGHIQITINKRDNALFVVVEDNGIGRNTNFKAEQPEPLKKKSFGIPLTEERLKILNETKNVKAYFTVTDLFTKDNQPAGTKVELSLPLILDTDNYR